MDRTQRAFLWFAFALSASMLNYLLTVQFAENVHWFGRTHLALWTISWGRFAFVFIIEFVWQFLTGKRPPRRWRFVQALDALAALSMVLGDVAGFTLTVHPLRRALVAPFDIWLVVEMGRLAWKGNRDARAMVAGSGVAMCCLVLLALSRSGVISVQLPTKMWAMSQLPTILILVTMVSAVLRQYVRRRHEVVEAHAELRETYDATRRFVPVEFLTLLGHKDLRRVQLGDHVDTSVTVLFSDMRGFTTLSEQLSAKQTFHLVNDYLSRVTTAVHLHSGFVDKFIGDAVLALFGGAPRDAVCAARAAFVAMDDYNEQRADEGLAPVRIGIGLHVGPLTLGAVGSDERLSCTVIGDTVNLASRVESLTGTYGVRLLVTRAVADVVSDEVQLRELDLVRVKGKTEPVALFEVLDVDPEPLRRAKLHALPDFTAAVAAYRAGQFADASALFERCESQAPGDTVATLYQRRCAQLQQTPPATWDGITTMTSK